MMPPRQDLPILSVVTTLYSSERYLLEFHRRVSQAAQGLGLGSSEYEIVLVDDGSPDASLTIAIDLAKSDPSTRVVELSRNFGHHAAIMAGLERAQGTLVFLIDADLEEPPEVLAELWQMMHRTDADVVFAEQDEKAGGQVRKFASDGFYRVFNWLSDTEIPSDAMVARLMTDDYVAALLSYSESTVFLPAIWADVGFREASVQSSKSFDGESTYTMRKRLSMAVDAITSFSAKPLYMVFYFGCVISFSSIAAAAVLVLRWLIAGTETNGWTSIIVTIFVGVGLMIFCIGLIGIYLARIFDEAKARPRTIVRREHPSPASREYE